MNKYIQLLRDHLASQPIEFQDWDVESLLEFLFCCYTEDHPLGNEAIHRCYEKMEPFFESLPRDASNQLFKILLRSASSMSLQPSQRGCA